MDQFDTEHTVLRFSIRTIFTLTTVASVCCFALAWISSDWSDDRLWRLLLTGISITFVTTFYLAMSCFRRYQTEKQLGRIICLAPLCTRRAMLLQGPVLNIVGMLITLIGVALNLSKTVEGPTMPIPYLTIYVHAFYNGIFVGRLLIDLWWKNLCRTIEFCSNGIVLHGILFQGGAFVPWSQVELRQWKPSDGTLRIKPGAMGPMRITILPEERAQVDAVLAEHIQKKES